MKYEALRNLQKEYADDLIFTVNLTNGNKLSGELMQITEDFLFLAETNSNNLHLIPYQTILYITIDVGPDSIKKIGFDKS